MALGKEGRPLAVYIKQTVATDNKKCSEIGNKFLNSNGSGVDAATAAMYMMYPETQKDKCCIHRGGVGNAHSNVSENSSSEAFSDLDRISEEQLYLARKSEGTVMNGR